MENSTQNIFANAISIEKLEPRLELASAKKEVVSTGDAILIR